MPQATAHVLFHSLYMQQNTTLSEAFTWGLRFTDAEHVSHVADALLDGFRGKPGQLPLLVTPNVDILVTLEDCSPRVFDTVERAAVVLADGQPLVSFSRFAGDQLSAKLAGSDLTARMWPALCAENRSVFAIVSEPKVGEILGAEHSGLSWVEAPMLPATEGAVIDRFAWSCIEQIADMDEVPEFLFAGVGFPKDILLARSILDQWPSELGEAPMILAVGASLEFITGLKHRAPMIFRKLGLEFVHRMLHDPKRLVKRYLLRDSRFVMILGRHLYA